MRYELKRFLVYCMYPIVWPFGLSSLLFYKALGSEGVYDFSAKFLSLVPGKLGQYLRTTFYKMTLAECHYDLMVGFCSHFAHPTAVVGRGVGIGDFSVIGTVIIEDNVMISSRVSILSGKYQHGGGDRSGNMKGNPVQFETVRLGRGSWLGEGSIVMANIGEDCIVSAGSVVTKPMSSGLTAVGNPARFISQSMSQG